MSRYNAFLFKPLITSVIASIFLISGLGGQASASQKPLELKPYSASYQASIKGIPFGGSGKRTLRKNDDGSWTLEFGAKAAFFGMMETSQFNLKDQYIISHTYTNKRSGIGGKPTKEAHFDWKKQKVSWQQKERQWSMTLPDGAIDNLAYQLQLRIDLNSGKTSDFTYQIADDDEVYQRTFLFEGEEVIETDAGKLETVRIKIKRDTDKRATWIWFAKNWNYFMVKLLQREGDSEYTIEFKEATIDGVRLTGK